MIEVDTDQLQAAVERMYGCRAQLHEAVPVIERFEEQPVWEGIVHVFNLEGYPTASRCYAWSSPIDDSERRRFYAVLHVPPVDSPLNAVRAAIVADIKAGRLR
jgi:hypothetical protein